MSHPELPKSSLDGGRSESVALFVELPLVLVGLWEAVWLVLLLAGNGPRGQIWSVLGRWVAMFIDLGEHHPVPGGPLGVEWGVFHPVALMPLILVFVGLVIASLVAVRLIRHGLPTRERRQRPPKGPRGGGRGRKASPRTSKGGDQLNMSMEEWLDGQAAGRGEDD